MFCRGPFEGAAGLIVTGSVIFGFGGIESAVPLLFFFISSSLFSKIGSGNKDIASELFDKTGARDIRQVAANGGFATLAALLYGLTGRIEFFYIYLASVSESAADTWATEIGTLSKRKPVSILTLEVVEPGTSGGISGYGTLAAFTGSLTTAYSTYLAATIIQSGIVFDGGYIALASLCGFAGSIVDSLLGASLQRQFKCPSCNKIIEKRTHCGTPSVPHKGLSWMNNDSINFSASSAAGLLMAVIFVVLR